MEIYKDALQAGFSYALKPSLLEASLLSRPLTMHLMLLQQRNRWEAGDPLLWVEFSPAKRKDGVELLSIVSRAVPSRLRRDAMSFAHDVVLPEPVEWIWALEQLPRSSTRRRDPQRVVWRWHPQAAAPP